MSYGNLFFWPLNHAIFFFVLLTVTFQKIVLKKQFNTPFKMFTYGL